MNKKNNTIFAFIGGVLAGGIVGVMGTWVYLDKRCEKKYESMLMDAQEKADYYFEKILDYRGEEPVENRLEQENDKLMDSFTEKERAEIREKLKYNQEKTTDYANMYHSQKDLEDAKTTEVYQPEITNSLRDLTEEEKEEILEKMTDPAEGENPEEEWAYDSVKNKKKGRGCRILSVDDAGDLPAYVDQKTLYFYSLDETLTDEDENEIIDVGRVVGDCLEKYNFVDNDEEVIYVMNYELDVCYEVVKVLASYGETHGGYV